MANCTRCNSEKVCRYNDGFNLYCKEDYECPHFAEVKHGEWIYNPETLSLNSGYTCSVCKDPMWHSHDVPQAFKYCPNCGAKMDGDVK